jgi:hypothetical protein
VISNGLGAPVRARMTISSPMAALATQSRPRSSLSAFSSGTAASTAGWDWRAADPRATSAGPSPNVLASGSRTRYPASLSAHRIACRVALLSFVSRAISDNENRSPGRDASRFSTAIDRSMAGARRGIYDPAFTPARAATRGPTAAAIARWPSSLG